MSCVCILTPVVIAAWPAFSAAVVAASASLGYQVAAQAADFKKNAVAEKNSNKVQLEIENSEVVTSQLGREQRIAVTRDGVTITFSRDARGKASLCVTGGGQSDDELRAMGEEIEPGGCATICLPKVDGLKCARAASTSSRKKQIKTVRFG